MPQLHVISARPVTVSVTGKVRPRKRNAADPLQQAIDKTPAGPLLDALDFGKKKRKKTAAKKRRKAKAKRNTKRVTRPRKTKVKNRKSAKKPRAKKMRKAKAKNTKRKTPKRKPVKAKSNRRKAKKTNPNTWGTSYFVSRAAAQRYYKPYGYEDVKAAVSEKIRGGEIHIGRPPLKAGQRAFLIDGGTRWAITEG